MILNSCYNFALSLFHFGEYYPCHLSVSLFWLGCRSVSWRRSQQSARNIVSKVTWFNRLSHTVLMLPLKLNSYNYFHMWNNLDPLTLPLTFQLLLPYITVNKYLGHVLTKTASISKPSAYSVQTPIKLFRILGVSGFKKYFLCPESIGWNQKSRC